MLSSEIILSCLHSAWFLVLVFYSFDSLATGCCIAWFKRRQCSLFLLLMLNVIFLWILFWLIISLSRLCFEIPLKVACSCLEKCSPHFILIFYSYISWLMHFIFRHRKVSPVNFLWNWIFPPCNLKISIRNGWIIYASCIGLLGQLVIKF